MSKELNIIEASKMPVGTEFQVVFEDGEKSIGNVRFDNYGYLYNVGYEDDDMYYIKVTGKHLNAKFIPIPKSVSFMEAIKAYSEGKRIKCDHSDVTSYYWMTQLEDIFSDLRDNDDFGITSAEILDGKWYIED